MQTKGAVRVLNREFEIRQAQAADAGGVLACLAAAFEGYREQYSSAGFADTVLDRASLEARMQHMRVLVAVAKNQIVGTIGWSAHDGEGHLRGMAVLPSWQGSGVAEELLRTAERELREQGCSRVTLDTTAPLQRAIRFYARNGYSATGKVADFFGMPLYEYCKSL